MEPYSDNPSTPEARRATRQREIQDMEAAAAGGDRHRSYVARRFLEEDADDLENEGLDLIDEKRPVTNSAASVASGSSSIFQRREQFQVDQSVNLMDASAATYDTKKKRYGGGLMDSSMVDIFMGEEDPAHRRGGDRSHRTPRDVFCSTRFLIFITCVIVGIMLVVFSAGGYSKGIGIGGNSEKDSQADQSKETPVPIAPNGFHVDRKKLLMNKISKYTSEEELEDESTHAHSALHWLTEDDEARLQFDDPGLSQRYALAVLYFSTQPSTQPNAAFNEWVKEDNWMTKEDVCTWYGVDCEKLFGYNSVVHLNMTANRLGGTLPSEIKALHNLRELDLSKNALNKELPDSLGEMTNLEYLILRDNQLSGFLPTTLGGMTRLKELVIASNKFSGILPDSIERLIQLEILDASNNMFRQDIPDNWQLPSIHTLDLTNNEFLGKIPHSSFQQNSLRIFKMGNNFLTGTLPPELSSFDDLEVFEVYQNRLHGVIPEIFDTLPKLKEINLRQNSFEGRLPRTFRFATSLAHLVLDTNLLTGTIPEEWGGMTSLESLVLRDNRLTGPIPTTIGNMDALKDVYFYGNSLSGPIPSEMGDAIMLRHIRLEHNKLTGTIPTEMANLHRLTSLRAFNNSLTGSMPEGVCDLRNRYVNFLAVDCDAVTCDCCDCNAN